MNSQYNRLVQNIKNLSIVNITGFTVIVTIFISCVTIFISCVTIFISCYYIYLCYSITVDYVVGYFVIHVVVTGYIQLPAGMSTFFYCKKTNMTSLISLIRERVGFVIQGLMVWSAVGVKFLCYNWPRILSVIIIESQII